MFHVYTLLGKLVTFFSLESLDPSDESMDASDESLVGFHDSLDASDE